MKKTLIAIFLFIICYNVIYAQSAVFFFNEKIENKNVSGLHFDYKNSIYTGFSYDRIFTAKEKNISLGIDFGSSLLLLSERNKRIAINTSIYLLKSDFNIRTQFSISTNFYEDAISKGGFMDMEIGFFPGYYHPKYFVASEISYTNNLFTTFNFKTVSPIQGKLILINTTGGFNFGLNGGFFLKKRLELKSKICYSMPRDFKNYPPFTQNIGFSLGASYWF